MMYTFKLGMLPYIMTLENEFASSTIGINGKVYWTLYMTRYKHVYLCQLSQSVYKIIL